MTYQEAVELPKNGAIAMNDFQMLAIVAEGVGVRICVKPCAIYDWAIRFGVAYSDLGLMGRTFDTGQDLMLAVINGESYHEGN